MQTNPQTNQNKPQITKEPLRWFWIATFADGTTIKQPVSDADDISHTSTDGTGNRFTDVLAAGDKLKSFELVHVNGKEAVTVDLNTGAFIINGTPFHAHDQFFPAEKFPLRLVYFRENKVDANVTATVLTDGSVEQKITDATQYTNRYFIGWQTTLDEPAKFGGKTYKGNIQITIAVG